MRIAMRGRYGLLVLLFLLVWPAVGRSEPPPQEGYATEPLAKALFGPVEVGVQATALNNWLIGNHAKLSADEMKGAREHLYYLIGSRVKQLFAETGRILPSEPDPLLALLFQWAERLGVFGGSSIYNAVRTKDFPEQRQSLNLPPGLELSLVGDLLELRSERDRWSVRFPYYFMLFSVIDRISPEGNETQFILISTGAARHRNNAEWSQATLVIIFSRGSTFAEFSEILAQIWGMNTKTHTDLGIDNLPRYLGFDEAAQIHKEFTLWETIRGVLGIGYLGVDGTYQWNRPHFLDFVRAMRSSG